MNLKKNVKYSTFSRCFCCIIICIGNGRLDILINIVSFTCISIPRLFPISIFLSMSLTYREERRLRVFENRVLRRVFGLKRDEVTGEWRKLHNEELNNLYSLPNIVRVVKSRRMTWAGHVARMGEDRGVHMVLVGKPEGKRLLGRPRRRWEDNIKMDLQEV